MKMNRKTKYALTAICGLAPLTGVASVASAQDCVVDFDFATGVGTPGLQSGNSPTNGIVKSFGVFDDGSGSGPALFASGDFDNSGGAQIRGHLAKWDGSQWNEVFPALLDGQAVAMINYDDGNGEALYFCGTFSTVGPFVDANGVAKWDGSQWSAVGPMGPVNGFRLVTSIAFYDDGTGVAPYIVGHHLLANGHSRAGVYKLVANQWEQVGPFFFPSVTELKVFDDGTGERLYAAGAFQPTSGFNQQGGVAVLNGAGQWENVGGAVVDGSVTDIEVWDDGTGPAMYIGGPTFFHAGNIDAVKVAKWDGVSWSGLGNGLENGVFDLTTWDDGTGEALYAVANIQGEVNGQPINNIGKWDGQSWSSTVPVNPNSLLSFLDGVPEVMIGFDDGNGPGLFIGGPFNTVAARNANGVLVSNPATHVTVVRGCVAAGCPADFTGDGHLDFFDISAFLTAFGAGDGAADFTGDGQFDFFDISAFLTAFSAGCP